MPCAPAASASWPPPTSWSRAEDATFALTEVKLGLAAAIISLTVHHRMNPRAAALTTLGGEVFSGAEAAAYGLVTRPCPPTELDAEVARVCASLATGAPQGLRESKRILNRDLVARIDEHGEEMARLSARLFASDEAREAMTAFLSPREEVAGRGASRSRAGNRPGGPPVLPDMTALAATRDTASDPGGPAAQRLEFDEFVAARSSGLLRTAYLLTHDHALAEDLLQTALTKAWFAWSRIEGRPEPYVRKVLVNTYASWWRRRWNGELATEELPEPRRRRRRDATPGPATPATTCGRPWTGCRAASGPWWCCATSRTCTEAETARLLGCSVGTVKSQTSKALAKLRIDPALATEHWKEDPR